MVQFILPSFRRRPSLRSYLKLFFDPEDLLDTECQALMEQAVRSYGRADLFDGGGWLPGKQQDVVAGEEGTQFDLPSCSLLIGTRHVQGVGHHQALKAEFFL